MRQKLLDSFPGIEPDIDEILPKKSNITLIKCKHAISIVAADEEILFFNCFDGAWFPSLKLVHKYPNMLRRVQVDKGAIKHVLNGADIMCPGITSAGGIIEDDVKEELIVSVMAEGKAHAVAVGLMKMNALDIKQLNKGIAIENIHHLNDILWKQKSIK